MTLAEFPAELRRRAEQLRSWGLGDDAARIYEAVAREMDELIRQHAAEELSLAQAARESGYSEDHLRHLVAEGRIPNAGRKGAPRIRRGDLPRKPTVRRAGSYDVYEDAASLAAMM